MVILRAILVLLCMATAAGCAVFKHNVAERPDSVSVPLSVAAQNTQSDPPVAWRAGLLPACSTSVGVDDREPTAATAAPIAAALGELFLGKAVDFGVNAFANAMSDAAERDKEGLSFTTSAPVYVVDVKREQGRSDYVVSERRCIVIARGYVVKEGGTPNWCQSDPKTSGGPCGTPASRSVLKLIAESLEIESPSFYAEIALNPSDTRDAISGRLIYLHYPQFLTERSGSTRDLFISATLATPAADPATAPKLATFGFTIRQLKEGKALRGENAIGSPATGWSPLLEPYTDKQIGRIAKIRECESKGCSFSASPATLTVTVRETGDVNAFLQYMSAWLATADAQKAIAEPIKDQVLSSRRAAAEAADEDVAATLSSGFQTAVSAALLARKNYEVACEGFSAASPPSAMTNLSLLYYMWELAYQKLVSAGKAAGEPPLLSAGPPARCSAQD